MVGRSTGTREPSASRGSLPSTCASGSALEMSPYEQRLRIMW